MTFPIFPTNVPPGTASYLPQDLFEIQSTRVAKLAELTDVLQTSVKSIQASFYNRASTEAKLSSLIANEILLEISVKNSVKTPDPSSCEKFLKPAPGIDSKSTINSVNNPSTTIQLETESITNVLTETSFYESLLNNNPNFETSTTTHFSTQTSTSLNPHQIPTWLDEKRKIELQRIPDPQQNLISKITLLKNSSLSKLQCV